MGWLSRCLLLPLLVSSATQAIYTSPDSRITHNRIAIDTLPLSEHELATDRDPSLRHSSLFQETADDDDHDSDTTTLPVYPHDPSPPIPKTNNRINNHENQIPNLHPPAEPPDIWPEPESSDDRKAFMRVANAQAQTQTQAKTLAARGEGGSSSAVPLIGMVVGLGCTTMAAVVFG